MLLVVLGAESTIGSYLYSYLFRRHRWVVIGLTKKDVMENPVEKTIDVHKTKHRCGQVVVLNAIQSVCDNKENEFIQVNEVFPTLVADVCAQRKWKFLHFSTDLVFAGKDVSKKWLEGDIVEENSGDAWETSMIKGERGVSKASGAVLRCSICAITGEGGAKKLLTGSKEVLGYEDRSWNGISALECARFIESYLLDAGKWWTGIKHLDPGYSLCKSEMKKMLNGLCSVDLDDNVKENSSRGPLLGTSHPISSNDFVFSEFEEQVKTMIEFEKISVNNDRPVVQFHIRNMEESVDRKKKMLELFGKWGIFIHFHTGIPGKETLVQALNDRWSILTWRDKRILCDHYTDPCGKRVRHRGMLSGGWAAMLMWRKMLCDKETDLFFISDDDVSFLPGVTYKILLRYMEHFPADAEMTNFTKDGMWYPFWPLERVNECYWTCVKRYYAGACCYMTRPSGLAKVLEHNKYLAGTFPDGMLSNTFVHSSLDLKFVVPHVALATDDLSFTSDTLANE